MVDLAVSGEYINWPGEGQLSEFLQHGEQQKFMNAINTRYRNTLIGFMRKCTPHPRLSYEDLEDAFQEMLVAVWKAIEQPGFDPQHPVRIVLRIARNKAIDHHRRLRVRWARETPLRANVQRVTIVFSLGAEVANIEELLRGMAQQLPENERLAIEGLLLCAPYFDDGHKWLRLSACMQRLGANTTPEAARSALRRALGHPGVRAALAKIAEELGFPPLPPEPPP